MLVIQSELQNWKDTVEKDRKSFSTCIFSLVEREEMTKLEALILLSKYKILPVHPWMKLPKFAEDYDYFDRYSTIDYTDLLCEEYFNSEDEWARFRNTTLEEAIDQVWDIVKDKKVIGCIYDW